MGSYEISQEELEELHKKFFPTDEGELEYLKKRVEVRVKGHTCKGLREHLAYAESKCIPIISEDGHIKGCDDTNMVVIKFCPYCGIELGKK